MTKIVLISILFLSGCTNSHELKLSDEFSISNKIEFNAFEKKAKRINSSRPIPQGQYYGELNLIYTPR